LSLIGSRETHVTDKLAKQISDVQETPMKDITKLKIFISKNAFSA